MPGRAGLGRAGRAGPGRAGPAGPGRASQGYLKGISGYLKGISRVSQGCLMGDNLSSFTDKPPRGSRNQPKLRNAGFADG